MFVKHGSVLSAGTASETKEEIALKNQRKAFWIKLVVAICIGQLMKYAGMQSGTLPSTCRKKRHVSGFGLRM